MSQKQKYPYIADQIIQRIESGEYPVNSELPTLNELTKIFNISRMTAQRALKILSKKGYVVARRGNKTRIISPKPNERLSILKGKHIGILGHFDVETYSTSTMPLKILYFLQQKLTELGNHVMCFQYVDDLDLRVEDFDCYLMIDLLGYRRRFKEKLEATGKPYLVVESISSEGCMHNHVHPMSHAIQLRLMNHFLRSRIEHLVVAAMDCKSVAKNMDEDEFKQYTSQMADRLIGPMLRGLENHGFPMENVSILDCGFQTDTAARMIDELIQSGRITKNTAFVTISENSAIGICKTLKKHEWKSCDFIITVMDPITRIMNSVPGVIGVDICHDDILAQVVEGFEHQFANNTNFTAGSVVKMLFRKHGQL